MFPNHHWLTLATYRLNAMFRLNAQYRKHLKSIISLPHRPTHTNHLLCNAFTSLLQ